MSAEQSEEPDETDVDLEEPEESNGDETEEDQEETEEDSTDEQEITSEEEVNDSAKTIEVTDNDFNPDSIEVEAGQQMLFENQGEADHTVTIEELRTDVELAPGESTVVTIDEEGEYTLYCRYHSEQWAPIQVT